MADLETVKVKSGDSYATINKSDYNPDQHHLYDAESKAKVSGKGAKHPAVEADEALRAHNANRGQTDGGAAIDRTRNPSGTFSEPTPSDVRYPNKDATEFENNHGAFVGKSAAGIRAERGMEDKPGGILPQVHEKVQEADAALTEARNAAAEAGNVETAGNVEANDADLDSMTVAELKRYAADHQIDLGGATTKADMRAAIDKA